MHRAKYRPLIDDAVLADATGRTREEWFNALDTAGGQQWDHGRIARWLGGRHDVDAWWAQSVAVEYIRARGLRMPGERSDGLYSANVSKTIHREATEIWPYVDDDEARRSWLDCEFDIRARTPLKSLRMRAADGSHITISLHQLPPRVSNEPRTRIDVTHAHLPSAADIPETLAFWRTAVNALARVVTHGLDSPEPTEPD
ncbi:MAG: hypothetical protein LKJ57_03410 [Ancrocorticia sp.]|nr:hypothetical protein [Ancrocorticia sp.]MCI1964325.1 hypothetical protein [Ancrocorticia sp.]MCI2002947.1 hypothetical protein [Ancrocorticia sp.]MCI2012638.1 hypothetical protein [Ancrocorticia sp.]MCI2029211.1 hypothetical protein [Ancrocorticia sp.]